MMKKLIVFLLSVVIMLSTTSCVSIGINRTPTDNTQPASTSETQTETKTEPQTETKTEAKTEPQTQPQTQKTGSADDYIGIYNSTNLDYTDGVGNRYTASYTVPELKLQSSDAAEINSEIQRSCMKLVDESVESSNNGTSLICLGIEYDAWMNNNDLTLLITMDNDWGLISYLVYTVDVVTGEELDNDDIAEMMNIDDDELEEQIQDTMLDYYVNQYSGNSSDFYYQQLEKTISEDNVDEAEAYINKDGEIYIHCNIFSIAGAEEYEHLIPLKK